MNKLVKNYVINTELKTTTSYFYQQLMFHTKKVIDKRIRIYRQKMRSFCYSTIIIRLNITNIAFELTRYFTNLNSNYVKTTNHCIKYLHATKYLAIRYSNSENEKLSNQISSSNKETTLSYSKLNRFSHSKLNKTTSSNKKSNDKQIFEKTINAFFANNLDRKSAENYIFKLFDDMID